MRCSGSTARARWCSHCSAQRRGTGPAHDGPLRRTAQEHQEERRDDSRPPGATATASAAAPAARTAGGPKGLSGAPAAPTGARFSTASQAARDAAEAPGAEPHADGGAREGTAGALAPAGPRGGAEAQAMAGVQPGPRLELLWEWGCEATEGLTATCLAWCKAREPALWRPPLLLARERCMGLRICACQQSSNPGAGLHTRTGLIATSGASLGLAAAPAAANQP